MSLPIRASDSKAKLYQVVCFLSADNDTYGAIKVLSVNGKLDQAVYCFRRPRMRA